MSGTSGRGAVGGLLTALLVAVVAACSEDPTGPQFEVIEDVTFASAFVNAAGDTLTVDLAVMTETAQGVWYQDLVVGTGDTAVVGDQLFMRYTGWVRDGTQFGSGEFEYEFGSSVAGVGAIPGIQIGMLGQQEGGTRLMVIPPEWAYGSQGAGNVIYPGAIVIFEVQLDSIQKAP